MIEVSLLQSLGQVFASETGQVFRDFLRGHVREMICEVMAAEVTELCSVQEIKPNSPGVKRTNVSRLWQEAGSRFVDKFRGKDLKQMTWCALILSGSLNRVGFTETCRKITGEKR